MTGQVKTPTRQEQTIVIAARHCGPVPTLPCHMQCTSSVPAQSVCRTFSDLAVTGRFNAELDDQHRSFSGQERIAVCFGHHRSGEAGRFPHVQAIRTQPCASSLFKPQKPRIWDLYQPALSTADRTKLPTAHKRLAVRTSNCDLAAGGFSRIRCVE